MSNPTALNTHRGLLMLPAQNFDFTPYKIIIKYQKLWAAYLNTIIYIVSSCLLTGLLTTLAGYVFSRKRLYFRNTFMLIISFTMLFNGGMIPTYMVIRKLGLIDSPLSMIIPGALTVFNIIIMRTSLENIPAELEEAARMDGASDLKILFRIILPLCKATFAVIMLFTAVYRWNDYFSALLYLPTKSEYYPLQMVLRQILITAKVDLTSTANDVQNASSIYAKQVEYASIVVSTLPILCVYPFAQKYFVTGMTLGAVKS
jgi:putative aldouronate transport system permease protein